MDLIIGEILFFFFKVEIITNTVQKKFFVQFKVVSIC